MISWVLAGARVLAAATDEAAVVTLWVEQSYPWDNPLHSEVSINGQIINIYTANTSDPIAQYLKEGWNAITVKTTPQEPATKNNQLLFRIGPAKKDPQGNRIVMDPVLWEFNNGTDWKHNDGQFSHPLGPDVKEVTLTYSIYYTGNTTGENSKLKAGDFVIGGKGHYGGIGVAWNSPVTATVFVNGTPLNTFTVSSRQVVITPYLKQGKNEIKLISTRVKNAIRQNDIEFQVGGPAE